MYTQQKTYSNGWGSVHCLWELSSKWTSTWGQHSCFWVTVNNNYCQQNIVNNYCQQLLSTNIVNNYCQQILSLLTLTKNSTKGESNQSSRSSNSTFTVVVIAHDVVWNFKQIPEISTVVLLSTIDKNKQQIVDNYWQNCCQKLRNNTNKKNEPKAKNIVVPRAHKNGQLE